MKNRILSVLSGVAIVAASFVTAPVEAAPDPSGIFTLSWPGSGDLGDNLVIQYNSSGSQNRGLPLTITNTAAVAMTNVVVPIIQDSDLSIGFYFASLPTNSAATSNLVFRFVASNDGGRNFTTQPWLTSSVAQQGSNQAVRVIHIIGATNFAGLTHIKGLNVSNTMTVGAGPMYLTNIVFTQKRRGVRLNS